MSSSHPNGTSNSYPPSARSSSYVTDSKADLVSMELSEGRNQVNNASEHLIKSQRNLFLHFFRMSPRLLQRPGTEERVWKNA